MDSSIGDSGCECTVGCPEGRGSEAPAFGACVPSTKLLAVLHPDVFLV